MGARERGNAPRVERERAPGREGVPQRALSNWEPPADEDDDRPILPGGARRAGGSRPVPMDEALTAVALPDEGPALTARPRDAGDDDDEDAIDTDRHPRLPKLPGITEEGSSSTSPTAPRPARREGRGPGRPTRERAPREGAPRESREAAPRERAPRERADSAGRADREPSEGSRPSRDDDTVSNIFLNVGRRDGVDPVALQRMLAETGGIPEAETSNIRVRDRITFVTVKKELADRAIHALAGQVIGGRTVVAEPARDKA